MKRQELFLDYIEKYLDYKEIIKEILMIDGKVFFIKNQKILYDYIKYSDLISELKLCMYMFGFDELYCCEDISDKKNLPFQLRYSTVSYSGGTSFNYEYTG